MITSMQMYWITILDNIVFTCRLLYAVLVAVSVILLFVGGFIRDDNPRESDTWKTGMGLHAIACKVLIPISLLMILIATLLPNTKQMAAIIVIPRIVNNEKIQEAGNRVYELAIEWMDELRPKKEHMSSLTKEQKK